MDDQRTALTERITFAEDWLARARQQMEGGEQTRGILTLLLAEAEVHRARELGTGWTAPRPRSATRTLGPIAAVAAAAVIVGAVALWRPVGPAAWSTAAAGEDPPPPVVSLSAGTGALLRLVQAPEAIERTITVPVAVRIMVRVPSSPAHAELAADTRASAPAPARIAAGQPAPRRSEASAAATVPGGGTETSPLLSEAELIDLVLATERSLRRSTNQ